MEPNLFQYIEFVGMLIKQNPSLLSMTKQQQIFPEVERMVVALIANADSVGDALIAYEKYSSIVPDWKFVLASEKGPSPGFSVNRTFSNGSVIRGLFSKERVLVLDAETRQDMMAYGEAKFPIDYSIALDTQALSYLAPYIEGQTKKIAKDFHEIFEFISKDNVFVDPIPYMTENLPNVLFGKNKNEIRRRLMGYEILRTIDVANFHQACEIRSTVSEMELNNRVDSLLDNMIKAASNSGTLESAMHGHTLLYCLLLKMATIELSRPKRSLAASKLAEFVEFMDNRMQTMYARETIVAESYFARGQSKFPFFGKIQKRNPDNLKQLKNMAWDLWHIRYIEGAVTREDWGPDIPELKTRYFFPSLLTCDKDFIEVIDLYPLKSYAYQKGSHLPIHFAEMDWIAKVAGTKEAEAEFIEKYYSRAAQGRRDNMQGHVEANMHAITQELEEEFSRVADNE